MNSLRLLPVVLVTVMCGADAARAYERLQGPTELLLWQKDAASNGYTLFGTRGRSDLIDMEGHVIHTWPIGTSPRLLDNGHLLDASRDDPSGFGGLKELDWDGQVVWEYNETRKDYAPHHDWVRIHNQALDAPTTLYLANRSIGSEQAIAAGADPQKGPYREVSMDAVVEVDMKGNVVWEWWFFDHVIQDTDPSKPNYVGTGKAIADHPGRININMPGRTLKRDWLHCNSVDYNTQLGQIVVNSVQGELYVIDHDSTFVAGDPQASIAKAAGPAGDFLYRFGDPARYGQGDPPRILENWDNATSGHRQMGGSHNAHWIPAGLPGAGHLMVFNNGQYLFERTPQSSIIEINPFLDATGRDTGAYVNPPEAGYREVRYDKDTHKAPRRISRQVVWSYQSRSNQGFFSHIGSGVQRLPNGNTLICAMTEGHLFEVTAAGDVVWEYINPITPQGVLKVLPDSAPMTNALFRAYRYGGDHPALKGRDLTPQGTITERAAQGLDPQPQRRPRPDGDQRGPRPRRDDAEGDDRRAPPDPRPGVAPAPSGAVEPAAPATGFVLRSPDVEDGGELPKEFTGDGASATLPLEWSGAPEGTKSFAVIMHHVAPDQTKWYWILYDIPAGTSRLPKNVTGIGTLGNNSTTGKAEYAPPHSKGPGPKTYIYTIYALSGPPRITAPPSEVNRDVLLGAMRGLVLGSAELHVVYTRASQPRRSGE